MINKASLCSLALAVQCLGSFAQTNLPACVTRPFILPELQLQPLFTPLPTGPVTDSTTNPTGDLFAAESVAPALKLDAATNSVAPIEHVVVSRGMYDGEFYGSLQPGRFYLIEPQRPSPSPVVRTLEGIFEPAPVRLGTRTTLSCSVITAIKRKNPLCLLNPIFFQLSW